MITRRSSRGCEEALSVEPLDTIEDGMETEDEEEWMDEVEGLVLTWKLICEG
jgi:hypothetical protein